MQRIGIIQINEQAEKIPNCIRFDKGSSKFPLPEEFVPHFHEAIESMRNKYCHYPNTGGEPELRRLIAAIERENSRQVSAENITITHGGTSGLFTILSCLTQPGDEIITSYYCFELFSLLVSHFGLTQIRTDFSQIDKVEKAVTQKTKLIIFNSPENPTGKVYSQKEVNNLVELSEDKRIWLLSDEVMRRVVYDNISWCGPDTNNKAVIVVNSFSKTWFVPGSRVGWIVSKDEQLGEFFGNSLSMQTESVSLFSQAMMTEVLKSVDHQELFAKRMIILSKRRNLAQVLLARQKIRYFCPVQGGMNFYVDLEQESVRATKDLLENHGVALIPGQLFEGRPSTYARLGFGASSNEEIERGISIIARFFEKHFINKMR